MGSIKPEDSLINQLKQINQQITHPFEITKITEYVKPTLDDLFTEISNYESSNATTAWRKIKFIISKLSTEELSTAQNKEGHTVIEAVIASQKFYEWMIHELKYALRERGPQTSIKSERLIDAIQGGYNLTQCL